MTTIDLERAQEMLRERARTALETGAAIALKRAADALATLAQQEQPWRDVLTRLVDLVPEPELVYSLDEPQQHRTLEEHELGYALHLARELLAQQGQDTHAHSASGSARSGAPGPEPGLGEPPAQQVAEAVERVRAYLTAVLHARPVYPLLESDLHILLAFHARLALEVERYKAEVEAMGKQEPVAWRYRYGDRGMWKYADCEDDCNHCSPYQREPLYAAPRADAAEEKDDG